jgi:hypothetical protein
MPISILTNFDRLAMYDLRLGEDLKKLDEALDSSEKGSGM